MKAHGKLYGLVLAGGQSSRMGQDKSRLIWQGEPLYQHMISRLTKAGIRQVLLSGHGFSVRAFPVDSFSVKSVSDIFPGRGPLSGIHAAVDSLSDGDRLLAVPVDMPLLPVEAIRMLSEQHQLCHFDGYNLPVMIPVTDDVRQVLAKQVQSQNPKDYALWRLYQALDGQSIALPPSMVEAFCNVNTPNEWRSLVGNWSDG